MRITLPAISRRIRHMLLGLVVLGALGASSAPAFAATLSLSVPGSASSSRPAKIQASGTSESLATLRIFADPDNGGSCPAEHGNENFAAGSNVGPGDFSVPLEFGKNPGAYLVCGYVGSGATTGRATARITFFSDNDSDDTPDASDLCPQESGPAASNGCPDPDGDGVHNGNDRCQERPGPAAFDGCLYAVRARFPRQLHYGPLTDRRALAGVFAGCLFSANANDPLGALQCNSGCNFGARLRDKACGFTVPGTFTITVSAATRRQLKLPSRTLATGELERSSPFTADGFGLVFAGRAMKKRLSELWKKDRPKALRKGEAPQRFIRATATLRLGAPFNETLRRTAKYRLSAKPYSSGDIVFRRSRDENAPCQGCDED